LNGSLDVSPSAETAPDYDLSCDPGNRIRAATYMNSKFPHFRRANLLLHLEMMQIDIMESTWPFREPATTLMTLPTEIHLLISKHLSYPDALSLKHTNQHFYRLIYTGVHLKIEWLLERRGLHLDCPNDRTCELGTDVRFCRGSVAYASPLFELTCNSTGTNHKTSLDY
jgi:hypothetical protein